MLPATCSVTRKRLNIKHLAKIRVVVFATLKTPKTLICSRLRAAPNVSRSPLLHHFHTLACHSTLLPVTPRSCQPLYAPTSHSSFSPVTLRSHLPLYARICHSTLASATPRSHQSLHAPTSHSTLPPVTPTCLPIKPAARALPVSSCSH